MPDSHRLYNARSTVPVQQNTDGREDHEQRLRKLEEIRIENGRLFSKMASDLGWIRNSLEEK